jgi:hypothetical protein
MRCAAPPKDSINYNTPLRLSIAAAIACPDGSMTASGVRREGTRGRLVIEHPRVRNGHPVLPAAETL